MTCSQRVIYVKKYKDCLVLDIGANIGHYTMFAAKIGRNVVSVEPFEENILRIHKAK
jgi:FkbM family methyltransferase